METSEEFYRQCVKKFLASYESLKTDDSHIELIFDDERMRYMVVWVGWRKHRRIHECAIHIDIYDGDVVIQRNDTEDMPDEELVKMGIPKSRIRSEIIPPEARFCLEEGRCETVN
jgi:hypothetical protein